MIDEPLPLLTLFTRLREAGLPLGLGEYQLALQSLQAGFGLSDPKALAQLCRTLWIKSEEEGLVFDYHFEQLMGQSTEALRAKALRADIVEVQRITERTRQYAMRGAIASAIVGILLSVGLYLNRPPEQGQPTLPETPEEEVQLPTEGPELQVGPAPPEQLPEEPTGLSVLDILLIVAALAGSIFLLRWLLRWLAKPVDADQKTAESIPSDSNTSPLEQVQDIPDEVQLAQVVQQTTASSSEISKPSVVKVGEYFPITSRQLKQGWRYLRRSIREGPRTEFDLEATVHQIGQQGMLLDPIFVPPRKNRTELALLIDQEGSMVPFHGLSQRIADTALRAGRLGRAGIYYFHNCPTRYLYRDPMFQEAETIDNFLAKTISSRTVVLIFSDAGAARGSLNLKRVDLTTDFLTQLDQKVSHVVWLNPLPYVRWQGTTAEKIAQILPMFEASRQDFQNAIDVLRGRRQPEVHIKRILTT